MLEIEVNQFNAILKNLTYAPGYIPFSSSEWKVHVSYCHHNLSVSGSGIVVVRSFL